MQVKTGYPSFQGGNVARNTGYGGNGILGNKPGNVNGGYGNKSGARFGKIERSGLRCDFCGKQGHVKAGCYRLIGWPNANQKYFQRGKFRANNVVFESYGPTIK
ncbi:hypothetical protein LIER_08767 [Lithospermum erythrorhizon]|uniref:CCHC-type domain-containing protein n=1 Tax=Lithospermum erythrorhizon TaxID=34254 RepID=A0AAV3PEI2_LITER